MYVVAGSPRAMRAVARAALRAGVDDPLWHESLCLNSGRIGGAARGSVPRAPPRRALDVCKRAASHRASGVRALGIPSQACPAIFLTAQSQHPTSSARCMSLHPTPRRHR